MSNCGCSGFAGTTRNKGKNLFILPDNYTVVDVETTGLDPKYCDIIEIGAVRIRNGEETEHFQTLVKPDRYQVLDEAGIALTDDYVVVDGQYISYVDSFVAGITGITTKMLEDAPDTEHAMKEFLDFAGEDIIVGHNIHFDLNFLYDTCMKHFGKPFQNDFVDTWRIAKRLHRELQHHRLIDLVDLYGVQITGRHRALADCYTTEAVLKQMAGEITERYGSIEGLYPASNGHHHSRLRSIKPEDITATTEEFDEEHPLYGKLCCFTGTLERLLRKDAWQIVKNCGGDVTDSVSKKVNYLVLGNFDYNPALKGEKSSKLKKAEELKKQGNDIEIMSENVFYDLICDYEKEESGDE